MAKRNVQSLLDKILKESGVDNDRIRAELNRKDHIYTIDLNTIFTEVLAQLKGSYIKNNSQHVSLTDIEVRLIKEACLRYFRNVKDAILAFTDNSLEKPEPLFIGPTKVRVLIRSKPGSNASVFRNFISGKDEAVRKYALIQLRKELYDILLQSGSLTKGDELSKRIYNAGGGTLDPGHAQGSSVNEYRVSKYIQELEVMGQTASARTTKGKNPILELVARVNNHPAYKYLKSIDFSVVFVGEQGYYNNRTIQRQKEEALLNALKKQIQKSLEGTDWGNFHSSSSGMERIEYAIMSTAVKRGAKVKGLKTPNLTPTRAKSKLVGTKEVTESSQNVKVKGVGGSLKQKIPENKPKNWSSLLPLINTRLPPRVMANMRFPSLINRTGTFANSASVVNIEQTREGFPSFVYDYERNPYNVFGRTVGRAPWNTPERDPSALVDKSVREIVREMAIGRFYTRRA